MKITREWLTAVFRGTARHDEEPNIFAMRPTCRHGATDGVAEAEAPTAMARKEEPR